MTPTYHSASFVAGVLALQKEIMLNDFDPKELFVMDEVEILQMFEKHITAFIRGQDEAW
jgi:hypothetical protein